MAIFILVIIQANCRSTVSKPRKHCARSSAVADAPPAAGGAPI
jgi:hypothetical protein